MTGQSNTHLNPIDTQGLSLPLASANGFKMIEAMGL